MITTDFATGAGTILNQPLVQFGREICGDLEAALRREWLVTNGIGGYASSSLSGIGTRSYHGLLVASLTPPVDRTVLVGGLVEWVTYDGTRYPLSTHEYTSGAIDPQGYQRLQSFRLEGALPVWIFALGDALLERRIWMAYGSNTTFVSYRLLRGSQPASLEITPLVTYHSFHALVSGQGWVINTEPTDQSVVIHAFPGAVPYRLFIDSGRFTPGGGWWWNFKYRQETERGLHDEGDLYAPGVFSSELQTSRATTLVLTTEMGAVEESETVRAKAQARQERLLQTAGLVSAHPLAQQLALAADQFIVERAQVAQKAQIQSESMSATNPAPARKKQPSDNKTIIAGYHWFNDWGRDTMIALRGLTLATNQAEDAKNILRTFGQFVHEGLLPNNFPDQSGAVPGYNTADATLWYMVALYEYAGLTRDERLIDELLPTLRDIIEWHMRGTLYHIGADPNDGLLHAGEPGVQLTWMDAKVGDYVVTPRIGKPVEINALWYNALQIFSSFLATRDASAATQIASYAQRVRDSFRTRFIRPDQMGLADVVDGPDGDDFTVRPNQIFAVSLPFPLIENREAATVVDIVGRRLLTTYGLRSLDPAHPGYRATYGGDQYQRDTGYHQGAVWPWLLGPYAEASYRVHGDARAALALLLPFVDHLRDAGLGSISEILDGDAPHYPRGCIAQAWSVAEILRVWRYLEERLKRQETTAAREQTPKTTVAGRSA
jgi:glycogen debranching enzyme